MKMPGFDEKTTQYLQQALSALTLIWSNDMDGGDAKTPPRKVQEFIQALCDLR